MFHFLVGRVLMKWLDNLTPTNESSSPEPEAPSPVEPPKREAEPVYPRVQRRAMGSLFEIYLAGTDREALIAAGEEALDGVERLERQLSHYLPDSDVSRLNRHAGEQWVRLEPKLYALLKRCATLSRQTDGAFDITAGPLVKAWGFFRGEGRVPTQEDLHTALDSVGWDRILFDDDDHLVYFSEPALEITAGAVGKGVAVDEAAKTLRFFGVENAVIHGGHSTIYAMGDSPERGDSDRNPHYATRNPPGWRFEIKDPRDRETVLEAVWLRNQALSTSGNYEQFFEVDGSRYSHIIDPRTGYPTQGMVSVSVLSPSAEETDALSTAFFVMGRQATEEYCKSRPNLRVIMVEETSGNEILVTRIGFPPEETSAASA